MDSDSNVILLWATIAYGYLVVGTFIWIQTGIGRIALRLPLLRQLELPRSIHLLCSFTVGTYLSYCFLVGASAVRQLNALAAIVYLLVFGPLACRGHAILHVDKREQVGRDGAIGAEEKRRSRIALLLGGAIVLLLAPVFVQTLLPNSDWDGAMYHLPLAKRFSEVGLWPTDPIFPAYSFPGACHLFYSLFLLVGAESAVLPFSFAMTLWTILGVYALAASVWNTRIAYWAAVICFSNNILWVIGVTPRIDSFLAFHCFMAVATFVLWIHDSRRSHLLIVCGASLGLAVGCKYTAIAFAVALALGVVLRLFVFHGTSGRESSFSRLVPVLLGGALLVIPSAGWYVRNAVALGDPMYPYLLGSAFRSEDGGVTRLDARFEARALATIPAGERARLVPRAFRTLGLSKVPSPDQPRHLLNVLDVVVHPDRYETQPFHWISPFLLLSFLMPLFLRDRASQWLFGTSLAIYLMIGGMTFVSRHAAPLWPLLSLCSALVVSRTTGTWWRRVLWAGAAAVLVNNCLAQTRKLTALHPSEYLSGQLERIEWLAQVGYNDSLPAPPFISFVNDQIERGLIERDAVLFMVGEGKGNLLSCRYLPDMSRVGYPWLIEVVNAEGRHEEMLGNLRRRGIEYIVFNKDYFRWVAKNVAINRKLLACTLYHFNVFTQHHGKIIYSARGISVVKLEDDDQGALEG